MLRLTARSKHLRLLELRIRNIRGITKLDFTPGGETFAIVGNNGTGKSAVVDAIDFLLTGDMGRLTGRRGVSLRDHGKHIKADPKDCFVEAKIKIPEMVEVVTLRRNFMNPNDLEVSENAFDNVKPFLAIAGQRQYVLTRLNILKFISAAPRDRAAQVQAVLNLDRVEELRQALTTARNSEKSRFEGDRASRLTAEAAICQTLGFANWNESVVLEAINRFRAILGNSPVKSIADAKKELTPPSVKSTEAVANRRVTQPYVVDTIRRVQSSVRVEHEAQLDAWDKIIQAEVSTLSASPDNSRAARQIELVELGIRLIDDATKCPLCDREWIPEQLQIHLQEKLEGGKAAAPSWKRLRSTADSMLSWFSDNEEAINRIVDDGKQGEQGTDPMALAQYSQALILLRNALADPLSSYHSYRNPKQTLSEQIGLSAARELLRSLYSERVHLPVISATQIAARLAAISPAQNAWDILTRVEENIKALSNALKCETSALNSARRLEVIRASFIDARDKVLGDLYNSVRERFVSLYKQLHSPEEQDFEADFTPEAAGVSFKVDFFGTGKVAPFALHSEGHQDSMGLCLFLALAENMQGTRMEFCLLDDVVMSIDAGHRLNIAKLLSDLKTDTQFIITTHDLTWVKQLQAEGCVNSSQCTRFLGWSLDGGPVVAGLTDFIGESNAALAESNVRDAAASLRYGLESFYHFVADSIYAKPPYSLSGQYEMGQMYNACCEKLKELVKKARQAAETWQQPDRIAELEAFNKRRSRVRSNAFVTQWAINANVHFNQWMNMTPEEFKPVLQAFKEVCDLFKCSECQSILEVVLDNTTPKLVKCICSKIAWNLESRK